MQIALTYDDVLLIPQYSEVRSRWDVDLSTKISPTITLRIPVVAINMDTVVGPEMARAMYKLGGIAFYPRFKPAKEQAREVGELLKAGIVVIPAVGIKPEEMERVQELYKVGAKTITIDVAHAHQKTCLDFIKTLKKKYLDLEIIAGVVASYEGALDLFEAGACTVRVGVGPGTICTTRKMTGFGVPQITATQEACRALKKYSDRYILTDGGAKTPGDMVKALACGASAVVVGSQLAGCEEAPGDVVIVNGKNYKQYNGSTSETEKKKQYKLNASDKTERYVLNVEGVESLVEAKGPVEKVLQKMEASMRSGFAYAGAKNIKEFWKKAKFIQVTGVSVSENGAHGVLVY